jgi:hypothetical protein
LFVECGGRQTDNTTTTDKGRVLEADVCAVPSVQIQSSSRASNCTTLLSFVVHLLLLQVDFCVSLFLYCEVLNSSYAVIRIKHFCWTVIQLVVLGGLAVIVLVFGPKVRGFKPDRRRWTLKGDKNQ